MDGKETRKPGGKQVFFEPVPLLGGPRTSKAEFFTPCRFPLANPPDF